MLIRLRRGGRFLSNQSGQSAIEFLFMLPFLVMIVTMSLQFYQVHRGKFDAVVEHRNKAIRYAMAYNASSGNAMREYYEPPVEKAVSIVIGSKVFPNGLKVSSSDRKYLVYVGTGKQ